MESFWGRAGAFIPELVPCHSMVLLDGSESIVMECHSKIVSCQVSMKCMQVQQVQVAHVLMVQLLVPAS